MKSSLMKFLNKCDVGPLNNVNFFINKLRVWTTACYLQGSICIIKISFQDNLIFVSPQILQFCIFCENFTKSHKIIIKGT